MATDLEIIALDTVVPQLRAPTTGDSYKALRTVKITPEAGTAHLVFNGTTSGSISFKAQAAAGTYSLIWPNALPGSAAFLKTDNLGNLSYDTTTYLTGNQTVTLSGDVTGSGATAITTTLANTAVTPGTYTHTTLTVDAKGRITSASSGSVPSPGGSSLTLQYNNAGSFAGMSGTSWDDTNRSLTLTGATVTTSNPVLNLSQTWNAGAVTFTGLKFNVTDTASAAGSIFLDLQVAGTSKFKVTKDGGVTGVGAFSINNNAAFNAVTTGPVQINNNGNLYFNTFTTILTSATANILEQRNSTTAQAFRAYNTYTDASNGEWFAVDWKTTANTAILGTQKNGTGSTRAISIVTGGTAALSVTTGQAVLAVSPTGGLGYGTGAGGTVTQATSRTTGVTLNTVCGGITLVSAAGSATWQSFTLTNSTIAATDVVRVSQKSGTDLYMIHVTNTAAGSCRITFATTGGTTTEQPVFNFAVIKAVTA